MQSKMRNMELLLCTRTELECKAYGAELGDCLSVKQKCM